MYSNGPNGQPTGFPTSSGPRPNIPLSALSNLAGAPTPSIHRAPVNKTPLLSKPEITSGPLDSNVLNNLAIALQLLIVSNIMNMPAEPETIIPNLSKLASKSGPKYESSPVSYSIVEQALSKPLYAYEGQAKPNLYYEVQPIPKQSLYYDAQAVPKPGMFPYEVQSLPNANFLGSSKFSEPVFGHSMGTVKPNPRSSMTLMSPYDALGTSLFAEPLSTFPTYSKKDFQSPYASILAADGARDLFSMSDLF